MIARGFSQAIAATTRASDRAGSAARTARRTSVPPALAAGAAVALISSGSRKGRVDDPFLRQFVAGELRDDRAIAKNIDAAAVLQLFRFRRVPDKGPPRRGLGADQIIDLELGAVVDAAHRVVHQDDARVGGERPGEQRLLLVAAGERQDRIIDVGREDVDAPPPKVGEVLLTPLRNEQAGAQGLERADADVVGDRPLRKDAVGYPVAGHQRDRPLDPFARARTRSGGEHGEQALGLAMAGETREADDLALARDQPPLVGLALRPDADPDRGFAPRRGRGRPFAWRRRALDPAHRRHKPRAAEIAGSVFGDNLTVAHDQDTVAGLENLAENVGDEHAADAGIDRAPHIGQKLPCGAGVERGGRLVEDDEASRRVGNGESARDLDHLPPADREVLRQIAGADAVAGKNLVELVEDEPPRAFAPAEAAD